MSYTLAINSSNVVGSNNNTFQYNFISGAFEAKDCEISVSSLTIPYSWFNITSIYNNKTISITFPYLATTTTLSVNLPDGFYQISDINNYIQQLMIANGLYIITSAGLYTYFFEIYLNTNYYNIQVILSAVPTTLTGTYAGYTQPLTGFYSTVAGNGLPTVSSTPSFTLASTGSIASVIGFVTGTYPSTGSSQSVSGTLTPNGSTVNALLLRCNLIYNNIGTPTDILDLIPINGVFGFNITYDPNFQKWLPIRDGRYSSATFTFTDQNLNTLYARDPNLALSLLVRKRRID